MCPGVIVHPFSGIIAWTGHSTDQHLLSSAWPDILCDSHILLGISLPVLFTWSSGWSFLLILQQGQSLWFLSGWFQVLLKLSCFFIACKACLQNTWIHHDSSLGSTRIYHLDPSGSIMWIHQDPSRGSTRIHYEDPPGFTTWIHQDP